MPHTPEEYHARYASCDEMPFAFADMEIVFDKERSSIDGLIRYGNKALASLEKTPLEKLVGNRFGNMDPKLIKCCERAALYGERLVPETLPTALSADISGSIMTKRKKRRTSSRTYAVMFSLSRRY